MNESVQATSRIHYPSPGEIIWVVSGLTAVGGEHGARLDEVMGQGRKPARVRAKLWEELEEARCEFTGKFLKWEVELLPSLTIMEVHSVQIREMHPLQQLAWVSTEE